MSSRPLLDAHASGDLPGIRGRGRLSRAGVSGIPSPPSLSTGPSAASARPFLRGQPVLSFPASVQGGCGDSPEPQHCPSEGQGCEPHHCPRPQRRFPALRAMPRVPGPPGPSRARPHRDAERPQVRHRLPCRSGFLRAERPRPSPPRPSPQEPPPNTPTSPRPPVFYDFNWHSVQQLYDPHVCSNGTFIRRLRAYGSPGLRKRFNSHEPTQARPFTPAAAGHETCSVIKATSAPCSSRLQRGGTRHDGEVRVPPAPRA